MRNTLELSSVLLSFEQRQVLTDIYLECKTHDVIGILGRNGSGKSSLLKLLFGTLEAQKTVRVNAKVYETPYKHNNLINYLPQHAFLPGNLQVKQVIDLYLEKELRHKLYDDKILAQHLKLKIHELSGGELRYLELKLLLSDATKFTLLDEPFLGIAPLYIEHLKNLIKEHSATKGIIVTDHDYASILDACNRWYVLHDGALRPIQTKNDLVHWGYLPASKI